MKAMCKMVQDQTVTMTMTMPDDAGISHEICVSWR